jgi:hypothetical protein
MKLKTNQLNDKQHLLLGIIVIGLLLFGIWLYFEININNIMSNGFKN